MQNVKNTILQNTETITMSAQSRSAFGDLLVFLFVLRLGPVHCIQLFQLPTNTNYFKLTARKMPVLVQKTGQR